MRRREFLAATVATPMMQQSNEQSLPATLTLESGELTKADLPTPALVLDLARFESNLRTMAEHCRSSGVAFRPHAKTHKCPEVARRQLDSGALGICVATVAEADAMVAAGVPGVLLTSPIIDPHKIRRVVNLIRDGADLMVSVGHPLEVNLLAEAAAAARVSVPVLLDIDVGDRRTGVLPGEPALELARAISRPKHLQLRGVQAYAGHASHTVGFEERQRASRNAIVIAVETRDQLVRAGFPAEILSGGSTGTYNIDSSIAGVTELQVGSYVFMDVDYRRIGGKGSPGLYRDFLPSLTVLTSVVSASHSDRVTVDAGTKALDTTTTHRPESNERNGLIYNRAGDEFGSITAEHGASLPRIGDRLEFIVPHCDPTVNLYDRIYAARGDKIESIWFLSARREARP